MTWRVPLADIDFGVEEEQAVQRVVRSRWLSMGEETQQFEAEFAAFLGVRHAIAVTNATAALHLACLAAGLQPGDEAIVPSLTFVATANAVRYTGARPVFADIEGLDWLTLSPESIERCISPRTKVILVMHYGGYACNMPAILAIAEKHNLIVLEDSAHAIGSEMEGRKLGTWGKVGCFSFFSNKNMTTGEGGMLVTNDDATAAFLRILRSHGMTSLSWDRHKGHAWTYDVVQLGYNYRIDEIRSALGRVQLQKLPANNRRRAYLANLYRTLLAKQAPAVLVPFQKARGSSCHHILPVLLPPGVDRLQFMESMKSRGVQTSIHYPPIHHFRIYQDDSRTLPDPLMITEQVGEREVTLPLFPGMSDHDVEFVVEAVGKSLPDDRDSLQASLHHSTSIQI